ncbi:MAG: hypothetical protein IPK16_10065 [Anaerolineales bacterium]|nr:hypothetical protein [Anaerolineales bacterium]
MQAASNVHPVTLPIAINGEEVDASMTHGHGSAVTLPIALDGEEMDASMTTDTAVPSLPVALDGGRWIRR